MLLLPSKVIPRGEQWLYELKFDGFRGIAVKDGVSSASCRGSAVNPLKSNSPAARGLSLDYNSAFSNPAGQYKKHPQKGHIRNPSLFCSIRSASPIGSFMWQLPQAPDSEGRATGKRPCSER